MLLALFGALDIAAGAALALRLFWWPLGLALLVKGTFSIIANLGNRNPLDWAGWIDVAAGLCLVFGWAVPLLWLAPLAKGLWSVIIGLGR